MSELKEIIKKSLFGKIALKFKHSFNRIGVRGYVLMLHRVGAVNISGISENENMKVSPEFLERFILEIQKNYDIIALSDIYSRLKTKQSRKFVCFTFDDGYKDNLTLAYPIFKKLNVPFTIFVAASFPNRTVLLWWFKIEDLILKNDCITLSNGSSYNCKTLMEKNKVFSILRNNILQLNQKKLESELNSLLSNYNINWKDINEEFCLSWEDIKRLHKDSLVTIGAHTAHHYNLKQLKTCNDVRNEIVEGIQDFEKECGFTPKFFAYPFGSPFEAGEREYRITQEIGFKSAYCGCGGGIKKNTNPYSYPRIALMDNIDTKKLF